MTKRVGMKVQDLRCSLLPLDFAASLVVDGLDQHAGPFAASLILPVVPGRLPETHLAELGIGCHFQNYLA